MAGMNLTEFKKAEWSEINKMTFEDMRATMTKIRHKIKARVKDLINWGHYSGATEKLVGSDAYDESVSTGTHKPAWKAFDEKFSAANTKSLSRNALWNKLAQLKTFVESPTSTRTGIKLWEKRQDMRIFGKKQVMDSSGNWVEIDEPSRTMTAEERRNFWRVHDEFYNQESYLLYGSTQLQYMLGEMHINGTIDFSDPNLDLQGAINQARDALDDARKSGVIFGAGRTIYSGPGRV